MKKDSSICFRASNAMRDSLIKISREDRRSLSSTIAIILSDYIDKRVTAVNEVRQERRQYPRKFISAPALINHADQGQEGIAAVTEISLGGLKLMIPKGMEDRVRIYGQGSKFDVSFSLPNDNKPIRLSCESRNTIDTENSIHIGASFVDADFQNYKALQTYLM